MPKKGHFFFNKPCRMKSKVNLIYPPGKGGTVMEKYRGNETGIVKGNPVKNQPSSTVKVGTDLRVKK